MRTDELGGVQCAGSRGAAKDRPAQARRPACVSVVTPPVATLWVGWTLKLSFGDSGRLF